MFKTYKYIDTRQYIRMPSSYLIRYKALPRKEIESLIGSTTQESYTKDISAGGVTFVAKEALPVSAIIEIEMGFPAIPNPVKVIANVVRAEPIKRAGTYKIAAQFLKIKDEDKAAIDKYIKKEVGTTPQRKWWWRKLK